MKQAITIISFLFLSSCIENDIIKAHEHSSDHKKEVLASKKVGCFYCLEIYSPDEIKQWSFENTAICSKCGIDAIIGTKSGYKINKEFLAKMKKYWF